MSLAVHQMILALLDAGKARYRVLEHEPAGLSQDVSLVRGTRLEEACKAMAVRAKPTKKSKERSFFLLVFPSDKKADFGLLEGFADARLCDTTELLALTDCEIGTVPPFSFNPDLQLIADPSILQHELFWFNAGLLDRSIQLNSEDYVRIAKPKMMTIVKE